MRISLPSEKTATKHCNAAGFDAWRIEKIAAMTFDQAMNLCLASDSGI